MKTYKHLWEKFCAFENLQESYKKARKYKSSAPAVIEFEKHWQLNLLMLKKELESKTYKPLPLRKFVLRDPKTRIICVSNFRDRIVHHALVNVLQPIFEPRFIHDSYASRKGKGNTPALNRFDHFKRKITRNGKLVHEARNKNQVIGFALKCDIKHYFETVDHEVLLQILASRVNDEGVLLLARKILENYKTDLHGKGMPLGNWTSQWFANVYLNELDKFIKHVLKAKYYIRYVDDFVILHHSKKTLHYYESRIFEFLKSLKLELHPNKCKIIPLVRGVSFLGFRVFYYHKLVRKRNVLKLKKRSSELLDDYEIGKSGMNEMLEVMYGWNAYAMHGNTYKLRKNLVSELNSKLELHSKEF